MNENKMNEVKDKVVGSVKEVTGKITDNPELEFKGKLQKGRGKAYEFAGNVEDGYKDVKDKVEDGYETLKDNAGNEYRYVRDKVVGGTKETVGKLTDNEVLQLRGALQKRHISDEVIRNVLIGVGTMAGLYLVKKIIHKITD